MTDTTNAELIEMARAAAETPFLIVGSELRKVFSRTGLPEILYGNTANFLDTAPDILTRLADALERAEATTAALRAALKGKEPQ